MTDALGSFPATHVLLATPLEEELYWLERGLLTKARTLWEITRGGQVVQVLIEITATAWASDPLRLPEDTRQALETDGRNELLKVLDQDDPPRVIRCGSAGCAYLSVDEVRARRGTHRT